MRRSYKIMITGGGMEFFVLISLVFYHVFFSHTAYSMVLEVWGNLIHPLLFGGIGILLVGSVIFYKDRKKIQKI